SQESMLCGSYEAGDMEAVSAGKPAIRLVGYVRHTNRTRRRATSQRLHNFECLPGCNTAIHHVLPKHLYGENCRLFQDAVTLRGFSRPVRAALPHSYS